MLYTLCLPSLTAVFRGFLLPSLTRGMPSWAAVAVSSAAFGAAHLSARDLPVLVALGGLLGFSYIRRWVGGLCVCVQRAWVGGRSEMG